MHADDATQALGIKIEIVEVKELSEIAGAFDRMSSLGVAGVAINADPVFFSNAAAIAGLARAHKLPSSGEKELGIAIPPSVLARADEVIE